MDYVKETLQRQSAMWTALFVGGEEIEQTEQERLVRETQEAEWLNGKSWEADALSMRGRMQAEERSVVEYLAGVGATSADERTGQAERTQTQQELLIRSGERLLSELILQKTAERNGEAGQSVAGKAAWEEALAAEDAQWEAEAAFREGRTSLETADARAISRRFERDARRYDGGFVFY